MIPDRRVCEIHTSESSGSGLLITDQAVLTANHVLSGDDFQVRFPEGDFECQVVWRSEAIDAAVLRITDQTWMSPVLPPLRWGRLVTGLAGISGEAAGFPESHEADWAHASGVLNALDRRGTARIDLQVNSWPRPPQAPGRSLWRGMSGAALFTDGLLTGLIVEDPPEFESRRLTAVRIEALRADPGFVEAVWGAAEPPALEPAEIAGLQARPATIRATPAGLLRADAEVVPFHGREDVLAGLREWRDTDVPAAARVLTGPGGQGKSRVAREFARDARTAGWLVVEVREDAPAALFERLTDVRLPLLLIVDEAEKHRDRLARLAAALPGRVRLLLVARTAGTWLHELTVESRPFADLEPDCVELGPYPGDPRVLFRAALTAFAERMAVPLPEIGTPPLTDRNVLAVQMEAMARLLTATEPADEQDAAAIVLDHESRHWMSQARAKYGLGDLPTRVMRQAVAVATLCTARRYPGENLVDLLAQVPHLDRQPSAVRVAVADLITDLYGEPGWQCAPMRPDPLHEHLVGLELADDPALLDRVAPLLTERQSCEMLTVLARSGAPVPAGRRRDYRVVVAVAGVIDALVRRHPDRMAFPAWFAAALVEPRAAEPLHAALDAIEHGAAARGRHWRQSLADAYGALGDAFGRFRRRTRTKHAESEMDPAALERGIAAGVVGGFTPAAEFVPGFAGGSDFRSIADGWGARPGFLERAAEMMTHAADRVLRAPGVAPVVQAVQQHPDLARAVGTGVAVVALASPLLLLVPESEAGQQGAPVRDGVAGAPPLVAPPLVAPRAVVPGAPAVDSPRVVPTGAVGAAVMVPSPPAAGAGGARPVGSAGRPAPGVRPVPPGPAGVVAAPRRPVVPAQSGVRRQPVVPGRPVVSARPVVPAQPVVPASPSAAARSASPPSPAGPAASAGPSAPAGPAASAEPSSPAGPAASAGPSSPAGPVEEPRDTVVPPATVAPPTPPTDTPTPPEPSVSEPEPPADGRFPIEVDAGDLTSPVFSIPGVEINANAERTQTYRLKPGRYGLATGSNPAQAWFTVTETGTVGYDDDVTYLRGRGTSRLRVTGLDVQIDPTPLTSTSFGVGGVRSDLDGTRTHEMRLLPARYRLATYSIWTDAWFTVTGTGAVDYDADVSYLRGRGDDRLVLKGAEVTVDARKLENKTFSVQGVVSGASTGTPLAIHVLPARYNLADGNRWSRISFAVTEAGRIAGIDHDYLSGTGSTTVTIETPKLPPS